MPAWEHLLGFGQESVKGAKAENVIGAPNLGSEQAGLHLLSSIMHFNNWKCIMVVSFGYLPMFGCLLFPIPGHWGGAGATFGTKKPAAAHGFGGIMEPEKKEGTGGFDVPF